MLTRRGFIGRAAALLPSVPVVGWLVGREAKARTTADRGLPEPISLTGHVNATPLLIEGRVFPVGTVLMDGASWEAGQPWKMSAQYRPVPWNLPGLQIYPSSDRLAEWLKPSHDFRVWRNWTPEEARAHRDGWPIWPPLVGTFRS